MTYFCPQTFNDKWLIESFFKRKKGGFFVEAGGADGITESSSYVLEKNFGWRGIILEPCDEFFETLVKNRESKCIHAALSDVDGKVSFITSKDKFLSGITANISTWHKEAVFQEGHRIQEIESISMKTLLRQNSCPEVIDFVHLDIEGSEFKVLQTFPFEEYFVRLFIVEMSDGMIREILFKNGFFEIKNRYNTKSPWDCYFVNGRIINTEFQP